MLSEDKPPKFPDFVFECGTHKELLEARLKSFFKMLTWRAEMKAWLEAQQFLKVWVNAHDLSLIKEMIEAL